MLSLSCCRALRESALASLEKVEGQLREAKGGRRENERETRAEQTLQDLQRRFQGADSALIGTQCWVLVPDS